MNKNILLILTAMLIIVLGVDAYFWLRQSTFENLQNSSNEAAINQIVSPYISDYAVKSDSASAIVVGVITPDGDKKVFSYGTNQTDGTKPNSKSLFHIGSITKLFTAVLFSNNVVNGTMRLDESPDPYLPSGVRTPSFNGQKITFFDLLTHYSGLPNFAKNFKGDPSTYTSGMFYAFLNNYRLPYAPGTRAVYSNAGFQTAGQALINSSGKTYDYLLDEVITNPLNMPDTSMSLSNSQRNRLIPGHKDGLSVPSPRFEVFGAGGLVSDADDMLNFLESLSGFNKSVLSKEVELIANTRRERSPGLYLGLGIDNIATTSDGVIFFMKGGSGFGYKAQILFSRNPSFGVILLSNSENFSSSRAVVCSIAETILELEDGSISCNQSGNQ